jgi:hypothetical protein
LLFLFTHHHQSPKQLLLSGYLLLSSQSMKLSLTAPMLLLPSSATAIKLLSFGDSQTDVGPTYKVVRDVLNANGVTNTVKNSGEGGTTACGWAEEPTALADAARDQFGPSGPDYVWLSIGANDIAEDENYPSCLSGASSDAQAKACLKTSSDAAMVCTETLLTELWKEFPDARVGMFNYEVPAMDGYCLEGAAEFLGGEYCLGEADEVACMVNLLSYYQAIYVDVLSAKYSAPKFTGMNILGACQKASGVADADVGSPSVTAGTKLEWMDACVHPIYGTPAADAVGEEMWKQWLKDLTGGGDNGGGDDDGGDVDGDDDPTGAASSLSLGAVVAAATTAGIVAVW